MVIISSTLYLVSVILWVIRPYDVNSEFSYSKIPLEVMHYLLDSGGQF